MPSNSIKPRIKLSVIESFLAVSRHGSQLSASEALNLEQSTISRHMTTLQEVLGVELFERKSHGGTLTPDGQRVLEVAKRIGDAVNELAALADVFSSSTALPELRVGTILDPEAIRMHELLVALEKQKVEPNFQKSISGVGLKRLLQGELDACFFLGNPVEVLGREIAAEGLAYRLLREETYFIVGAKRLGNVARNAENLIELANHPWITPEMDSSIYALSKRVLERIVPGYRRGCGASDENEMVTLVESGRALGFLRERRIASALQSGKMVAFPKWQGTNPLGVIYSTAAASKQVIGALMAGLDEAWPSPAPSA